MSSADAKSGTRRVGVTLSVDDYNELVKIARDEQSGARGYVGTLLGAWAERELKKIRDGVDRDASHSEHATRPTGILRSFPDERRCPHPDCRAARLSGELEKGHCFQDGHKHPKRKRK